MKKCSLKTSGLGLCIMIGLMVLGNCVGNGMKRFADKDRYVTVKGLAEREVLIEGVQKALKTIAKKSLTVMGIDLSKNGFAFVDVEDLNVQCVKGELCLDANLYGALYCVLHELK